MYEIIVDTLEDALRVEENGMNRIELVSNMTQDGLSPDIQTVVEVTEKLQIPVHVMVRFHDQGFEYSSEEFADMLAYIEKLKSTKAAGIVWGGIKKAWPNYDQIIEIQKVWDRKITFHRAIESCHPIDQHYERLVKLGVDHILTSGGKTLMKSLNILEKLYKIAPEKLLIGGGLSLDNIEYIMNTFPKAQFHLGRGVRQDQTWLTGVDAEKLQTLDQIKKTMRLK